MTEHVSVLGGRKAISETNEAMALLRCLDHLLITGHSTDLVSGDEEQNGSILPSRLLTAK